MSSEWWLQFSKFVSYFGLFLIFVSTISTSILSSKLDRIKDKRIDTLVEGNEELLKKVDIYQTDLNNKQKIIEELQRAAKKAERGISSTYDYRGIRRDIRPGVITGTVGEEPDVFRRMQELEKGKRWQDIINLCNEQIEKTPKWYTPYLFRGVAYANIGELEKAIKDVEYVVENTPGDPDYAHAIGILKKMQITNGKSK